MSLPRVSIIGAGQVGATAAHLLALKELSDVVLIDVVEGLAEGKALDISQSAPVEGFRATLQGTTDYERMVGSRVVVITAGMARRPGMSREDLLAANANIVGPIAERVAAAAPDSVLIVVTNPLDIMVALALRRCAFDRRRVMGMAGVLDSARLRAFIAARLGVAPGDVQAMVLGSHGDLMVPLKDSVTVNGEPISTRLSDEDIDQLFERTRQGGAEIVKLLKHSSAFYAPASGIVEMVAAVLGNSRAILPVCVWLEGEYGLRDVCLGVPAQVGARGIERVVEQPLSPQEHQALQASAQTLRKSIQSLSGIASHAR